MSVAPSWFTGRRLQTRLILWTCFVLILAIAAAAEIRTRYNIRLLESNLKVRSETLVSTLSKTLRHLASLPEVDHAELAQRLREFVDADRTLTRLDIVQSKNGSMSLLATSSDQKVSGTYSIAAGLTTRIESIAGERVMVTSAQLDGSPYSLVALSSLENIDRYEEANRWLSPAFSFCLMFLVITPLFFLYSRTISRRFDKLLEDIRRAQQGEISQIPESREDEIGLIERELNSLLTQVRTFSDGLQLEVTRATKDLHNRNLALEDTSRRTLEMQRQLLESERLATLGQMAMKFAAEIGSPMRSSSSHVQILLGDSRLSDDQRETLAVVRTQIQSVVQIVSNLVHPARRSAVDSGLVDLNCILETVVCLLQPKLTARRIDVISTLQPVPHMRGYALRLEEAFFDLINSASEVMPEGGRIEIRSWFDERSGLLSVRILHDGPGTGSLLQIVEEIVHSHRGTIRIAPMGAISTSAQITFPAEFPMARAV